MCATDPGSPCALTSWFIVLQNSLADIIERNRGDIPYEYKVTSQPPNFGSDNNDHRNNSAQEGTFMAEGETDLEFNYDDADTYAAEIAELYSYTEEPEFHENERIFKADLLEFTRSPLRWTDISESVRIRYIYRQLDRMDSVERTVRSHSLRCLLYLMQGVFRECVSTENSSEPIKPNESEAHNRVWKWTKYNVFLALRCGVYEHILQVLLLEIKYNEWYPRRLTNASSASGNGNNNGQNNPNRKPAVPIATCLADSRELRVMLAILYTIVETVRTYLKEKSSKSASSADSQENANWDALARSFVQDLADDPENPAGDPCTLSTVLFNMVHRFCLGHNPNFPVKKILLLLWKVLLVTLGPVTNLIERKNQLREAFNLPRITESETHIVVKEKMSASTPPMMGADILEGGGMGGRGSPPRGGQNMRAGRQGGKGPKRGSLAGGRHRPFESHEDASKTTQLIFGDIFSSDKSEKDKARKKDDDNNVNNSSALDVDVEDDDDDDDAMSTSSECTVVHEDDRNMRDNSSVELDANDPEEDDEDTVLVDEVEELEAEGNALDSSSDKSVSLDELVSSSEQIRPSDFNVPLGGADSAEANAGLGTPFPPSTPIPGSVPVFKQLHPPPSDSSLTELRGGSLNAQHQQHRVSVSSGLSEPDWLLGPGLEKAGLPWRPKVQQKDLEEFIQHARSKFIGFQAPGDLVSLFGLPHPIHEAVRILREHLYISLAESQIKREQEIHDYPLSKGKEAIENNNAERLYKHLLPNLHGYLIALLKILLAAAPTSRTKTESINILAEVVPEEMPTSMTQSLKLSVDVNRHKEIIAKAISCILFLLMKHWKLNHIYQFEFLTQNLVLVNCIPLLLKFINHNVLQYVQARNTLSVLDFPNCVLLENNDFMDECKANNDACFCCWRNMFTCINFLRILNKIIKWKNSRIVMLVVFKSAPILKRVLRVRHPLLQLYALKLLKLQTRYFGRQWRKANMGTVSAIYQKVRHRLTDDWAFGNDVDTGSYDFQSEEVALKYSIDRFNNRRYGNPNSAANPRLAASAPPINNCLTSLLNQPVELSDTFKKNYRKWLEDEVFSQPIDWDELLSIHKRCVYVN